ncbi:MAG: hypothetical protein ACTS2F_27530 [Thainema sp.]
MFNPTHVLVSRARKTPVQLVPKANGFDILTEMEWQKKRKPAFEVRPKQGIFCQGMSVVGYHLEPIAANVEPKSEAKNSESVAASASAIAHASA